MSFDLPLTAFALESSGTQPALGAVHTLTVRSAADDGMQAFTPGASATSTAFADAALPPQPAFSVLAGDPPPWVTLTF